MHRYAAIQPIASRSYRQRGMVTKERHGVFGRTVEADSLPTYRHVVSMHGSGTSLNGIARTLKDESVPTGQGRTWYGTVRVILASVIAKTM